MKQSLWLILCLLFFTQVPIAQAAENEGTTLQQQINQAKPNDIIKLKGITYIGPIVIDKPLVLIGTKGTYIGSFEKNKPAVTIKGKQVIIKELRVLLSGQNNDTPAIQLSGRQHYLESVRIRSTGRGILADELDNSTLQNLDIEGLDRDKVDEKSSKQTEQDESMENHMHHQMTATSMRNVKDTTRENGIAMYRSTNNTIIGNRINQVLDGIYIENSRSNTFEKNKITNSRYGLHLMFSKKLTIRKNDASNNFVGAMIMETDDTNIQNNTFERNKNNSNATGLQIYQATNTLVKSNRIENNRIGISLEASNNNQFSDNNIQQNFIGMRLQDTNKNSVENNQFINNVNDAHTLSSSKNIVSRNYWDSAIKVDRNKDGISDIPFKADPLFLSLTEEHPGYQLFFQSPGLQLVEHIWHTSDYAVLKDSNPLMNSSEKAPESITTNRLLLCFAALSMLLCSSIIFIKGRFT